MNSDAVLVNSLINRIASRLPHSTGSTCRPQGEDDVLQITRATIVDLSRTAIHIVLDCLLVLLNDIRRPFASVAGQPSHVLQSELYVLSLAGDSCSANWKWRIESHGSDTPEVLPEPLDRSLVHRVFDTLKQLLEPVPDDYILPAQTLFDPCSEHNVCVQRPVGASGQMVLDEAECLPECLIAFEGHIKDIIEFITASSWSVAFDYIRNTIYGIRTAPFPEGGPDNQGSIQDVSTSALVTLRLLSFLWIDGTKLGLIIQEICSSYLHFRKSCQSTIAVVLPLLVSRWIERCPDEFIRLHLRHKRLDGGGDTLFDMTQAGIDSGRRKAVLYPLQITLLLLLPDVFEVASNLREAKSTNLIKKVAFLDGLRKALKNGNERAAYCLVSLLRAARHFEAESDSALVSYAMDVQDEVRECVFGLSQSGTSSPLFDQEMITGAFVNLAQLNLGGSIDSLIETCTSPYAPERFKIAAIRTCSYFDRHSQVEVFSDFHKRMIPFIQSEFESACMNSLQVKSESADSDRGKVLEVLRYLHTCPAVLINDVTSQVSTMAFLEPFLFCVLSGDPAIRRQATKVTNKIFPGNVSLSEAFESERHDSTAELRKRLWSRSCLLLIELCADVQHNSNIDTITQLLDFLEARSALLKGIPILSIPPVEIPEMLVAASALEMTLLRSLCSPDMLICQAATLCVSVMVDFCTRIGEHRDSTKLHFSTFRNHSIYRELCSPAFHFTGMIAFQKRMRGLLRQLKVPTLGILDAWESLFNKWIYLSKDLSTTTPENIDDMVLSEWRNSSGFLAAIGGICTYGYTSRLDEEIGELKWIDRLQSEAHEEPPLSRFLRLSIQLLGCNNIKVREITRETLCNEISSTLFPALFESLESELEVLLAGTLVADDKNQDNEVVFAEQAVSLLKTLVEKLESPSDLGSVSSVHLGALTLSFAKFLNGATEGVTTLRVKIKICHLCEAVTKRKEHLNLRDDVRIRNQLLDIIFGWIARPYSLKNDQTSTSVARHDEIRRVQKDLDRACLRTLTDLTARLPLQPAHGQTDAGMSDLKSQMFHTFFNRFLSLLNFETQDMGKHESAYVGSSRDETISNADLIIIILSNLLSANIDVGLKHSLNIGYHENVEIRAAFVRVLCNILTQGTEFSSLTDAAVSDKYIELLNLLTTDLSLAVSMSAICPASEVDELTISLLIVFEQRGLLFELFEILIRHEIEQTENETEILRRTCVATKMLSVFARWKGASYLKITLRKVLERLMLTSQDLDLELDPTRVSTPEELQKNAAQLQIVAKVFMDDICASTTNIPNSFRKICSIISEAVRLRFPDAKYTAVGAFVFLRFFCPAIVAPEAEGLISVVPTKEMRRGLLLIAKIIQNLANNVLFGTKEPYMFPLNPFLVQNIHLVTGFLREISVPPEHVDLQSHQDTFDFASCVSLHRFLYDHWDHLRQTLVSRERRDAIRSPGEKNSEMSSILEPLRSLITNLGPPPLAISWNRPQMSCNTPPLYSRFQNFMLRNAFKSAESFLTSRAVYDGGESKDGLSIICIILRHIENENIDYDTLLFCYLKIASRLWHEPFGLFIDATCYNGRSEPSDDFFSKLELLTPSELSRSFSRVYVYNMNSTFKRCFRKLLRSSIRDSSSVFHPNNADYHLIGTLEDLQVHFHLKQLHLPKETISVVTETRFMFKSITRLSKSKGKVEVVIKVGSQFVQITTVKKQEVLSGLRLSSVINDIFRLSEVEQAMVGQAEDNSSFGLRADGGKVVMFFTSSQKADILQTILGAKAKQGKDSRIVKPVERLVRPQDVPGTMLNLALTNLSNSYHVLRVASYNLLGALCRSFNFGAGGRLVCNKELAVPLDPTRFIVNISRELAQAEPQLTSDFLTEFFVSWESIPDEQKPLSLEYVAPWLSGLRTTVLVADADADKGRDKVASLFRKLIDVAVIDPSLTYVLDQYIWPSIAQDELLLEIFVDELIKAALSYGNQADTLEILSLIVVGLGTISIRGRIISRLRKALNRSSLRPTRLLPANSVWEEICVLLQFCLALSFDSRVQSQLFLPEIFHIVTMLANTGSRDVRLLVYKLLINSIHAICASFSLDDVKSLRLRSILDTFCDTGGDIFALPLTLIRDGVFPSTSLDSTQAPTTTENLTAKLFEVCSIAAPSVDVANAWRARWMSLVASTAFQNNPAVQPRAFSVMGYLARDEVDDDLLYQVLVALRNSVSQLGEDGNQEMLVSIITSLAQMMAKLSSTSRYGLQLFWLAISLIRLVPANLFNCTAQFLDAVLTNIGTISDVGGERVVSLLLQCRTQLEKAAIPLDSAYGVRFDEDTFHFAVCACLMPGLTDTATRPMAVHVLSSFLEITTRTEGSSLGSRGREIYGSPYLALLLSRGVQNDDLKESLWWWHILNPDSVAAVIDCRGIDNFDDVKDQYLFLISAIELVDFHRLEDALQARTLRWLHKLAEARPTVFINICGALPSVLDDVLLHSQDFAVLEAAHRLLRTISSDHKYVQAARSTHSLHNILSRIGFGGLWRSGSHKLTKSVKTECFKLTGKLIELIVL